MGKWNEDREKITVDGFEYLIDREDKTAWINDATTGGAVEYTLPESAVIDGERYVCESVEIGAFWKEPNLEILNIPDTYCYIDEDCFRDCEKLHTVHIGAGLEHYLYWSFSGCPLKTVTISSDNRYLKVSDDGNLIMSKDGKIVYDIVRGKTNQELIVPEGVEEIHGTAISCSNIGYLHLPSTLKKIGNNGIFRCRNLGHLTIPEGVTEICLQGLSDLKNLIVLELPSTLKKYSFEMLSGNERLSSLVLFGDRVLEIEDRGQLDQFSGTPIEHITLFVPRHLVNDYRNHPQWGRFLAVKAYVPTVFGHHRDEE